ncbi:hypothetical protein AA313_de0204106 [Arthrobotrys entomopaga]|nr:hypothetical protein AA313_de0204106 [Arthrobotrys entomopaga]
MTDVKENVENESNPKLKDVEEKPEAEEKGEKEESKTPAKEVTTPVKDVKVVEKKKKKKDKQPEPKSPVLSTPASTTAGPPSTPPTQTLPSSAAADRRGLRALEDTPIRLEPQSIGKPPRTPNFGMMKPKLGASVRASAQKVKMAMDLDDNGTAQKVDSPFKSAGKGRYGMETRKADFDIDIASKIGTIQWDSDDD